MFRFPASVMPLSLRLLGTAAVVCSALSLVGCGGGSRAKEYQPQRAVVFGDENSALASYTLANGGYVVKGLVYTINPVAVTTVTTATCTDPSQTVNTLCDPANAITDATAFDVTAKATNPLGSGYHFPDGPPDTRTNLVTFIALGTATRPNNVQVPNAKLTTGVQYLCTSSANWSQVLVRSFSLGFRNDPNGCDKDYAGAVTYASNGWKVADVQQQVNAHLGELGEGVLVTVWVGQNDLYDLLVDPNYGTLDAKRYQAKLLAEQLAGSVKQIINSGARVILVGVADLGFSPYAVSQINSATTTDCDTGEHVTCNGDMQKLVADFNKTLKIGDKDTGLRGLQDYVYQGRQYAFVDAQAIVRSLATRPSYVKDKVYCESNLAADYPMMTPDGVKDNSSILYCNTNTYTGRGTSSVASTATYLWADNKRLGVAAHSTIGVSAYNRAANKF
ncbi:MAG: hypothetical protein HYX44_00110 [Aquabacterium sp.]|nr:hypothetical protein [Aquabacterium sp.]